jgi:dienelactone hydrolase
MPDLHQQDALTEARISIATLEAEVAHLTAGMVDLKASQAAMGAKLDAVLAQLSEAKGGWKTLMLVGGAASSMGAGLAWLLNHLPKG